MPAVQPDLVVADAAAWSAWLHSEHATSDGVWLILAKKGTTEPTSLSYDEALDEALCHGWIDGQKVKGDEGTYRQRFTPRRRASPWSERNVGKVAKLIDAGRMRPAGQAEIDRAKADGRWDRAYGGMASITVPDDLAAAIAADPAAAATFAILTSTNRYAILYRVGEAKKPETRARRIAQFVEMLARGETPHPQKQRRP